MGGRRRVVAGGWRLDSRCTVPALRDRLFIPWICIFRSQPADLPLCAIPHKPLLPCYPLSVPLIAPVPSYLLDRR